MGKLILPYGNTWPDGSGFGIRHGVVSGYGCGVIEYGVTLGIALVDGSGWGYGSGRYGMGSDYGSKDGYGEERRS